VLAGAVLGPGAGDADRAGFLGELLMALHVHDMAGRGEYLPPKRVEPRSEAMAGFASLVGAAGVRYQAAADISKSPNARPAGLETTGGLVAPGFQAGASSVADEITLRAAADLLGLSPERVRQLVHADEIAAKQERTGHRRWHADRASVIAYRERRSA
jgi:hypothetical protein